MLNIKPMHVLIIPSEEFVPNYSPTAGIFQYHQACVLKDSGHRVGVISICQSFSIPMVIKALFFKLFRKRVKNACDQLSFLKLIQLLYRKIWKPAFYLKKEIKEGITIFRIDGFYFKPPVENENHYGWIKAGLAAFEKYVQSNGRPDVIHGHNAIYAGMLCEKIMKKHGIPYVITEHSTVFARQLVTKSQILQRVKRAYERSSSLTAVSQPFCDLLNKTFSFQKFHCLPNVLDPAFESRKVYNKERVDTDFIFINIAELHPKKDHFTLLKAFKRVNQLYPGTRLWIGGDGKLKEDLKNFVQKENLDEAVQFLGLLNREQVFSTLQQADCFVLSSKYETFGVVVIEAMLFGKPVIVSNCGGPESFVTPDTGIIVQKENEKDLSSAMIEVMMKRNFYDSAKIKKYVLSNFGTEIFTKRVNKIYHKAISTEINQEEGADCFHLERAITS